MIFIPRFAAVALGILLNPAGAGRAPAAGLDSQPAIAGFDAIEAVFVGTVLDVWRLGDRQVARFVVERPARGTRIGEIIGVVDRSGRGLGGRIGAGERWMIVADRWLETA
ncbi:MAG: hypothetical protein ABIT71_05260 [Vicinamibacteraceae bacterium]